ncbi:hypothetical protein AAKU55_002484 [Oxalobacteraceae bacterium GrIS 1.11]
MPIIYTEAAGLEHHVKVGPTHSCVDLVKEFTALRHHSTGAWREGAKVLDNRNMIAGTAIATFVRGRYPNQAHNNHAAFFLRHGPNGFWVIDQWAEDRYKPRVSARYISSFGRNRDGTYPRASDNADAFSIIELN